jgi:hypothetical protein
MSGASATAGSGRATSRAAGVRGAVPGLGEQEHADRGGGRPDLHRAAAAGDRDAERPEELERARGPEREAGDGRHEAEGQGPGHDAEHRRSDQSAPGEGARTRPDEHEQQDARPREAQGCRARGADVVEQADRCRDPELDADDRRQRHAGAGTRPGVRVGGRCEAGHAPSEAHADRSVHVDFVDIPFDVLEQSS